MHTPAPSLGQTIPAKPELTLPPTSDLPRLLDLVALRLKVQIDYDPANPLLKGQQVTLRGGDAANASAISDAELWAITSRLLVQRGLTSVRAPGSASLTVVKLEDAARLARFEPEVSVDGAAQPTGDGVAEPVAGFRNQPVRLRHVSVKEAGEALRAPQRAGGGGAASSAGPVSATSGDVLILSDLTPRIEEQFLLLRQLDTAENATVVQVVPLNNVSPVQLAAAVAQLATKREAVSGERIPGEVIPAGGGATTAGSSGGAGSVMIVAPRRVVERWKQFIALADLRESVATQTYSPRLFSVKEVGSLIQQVAGAAGTATNDDRFKLIIEEPTGSLIVTATPSQHERIAALMERLDAVPGEARRPVRSFIVKNRPVSEFVATLQRLISAGVLEASDPLSSQASIGAAPSMATNVPTQAGATPLVPTPQPQQAPARPASGQSGVTGKSLALTLAADEPTNTLIAVGDGRLLDQLDALIKTLDVRQPQVMLEAVLVSLSDSDATSLGVELDQLTINGSTSLRLASLFGLGVPTTGVGGGGPKGGTAVVLDPGDYAVVVRALQTVTKGRTVSLPKVLVSNNQRATFNSVLQQPYAASFVAGNAATPTTSFGGSSDAGTQLTIRPQIGDGGGLLLDYNISISQFAGSASSANLPPPRQVTSVQSLATIPDGYTVVVGGLEVTSDGTSADQVPFFGTLPVIGELFKSQTKSQSKSRFFVFIHASVMRDQTLEALRYVSDVDAGAASLPPSWPRTVPQVVR
ncbi:MAG: secretin N-terminal domain-containing protein [Phycisphaerales bacterium]|nr:secretin N-terminal domain-containing protein [Phycisphaerales bacterium]